MEKEKNSGRAPQFTLEELQELMAAVKRNGIHRIKIKQGDCSVEIEGSSPAAPVVMAAAPEAAAVSYEAAPPQEEPGTVVKSPIVGTFYAAPSPGADPFVAVGSAVKKGDVLFIIESMKLMNEVVSDCDGTVSKIHVADAEGVEFGQPVLTIV